MIGNFRSEDDLFVFLEDGDLEGLEVEDLEGCLIDPVNPGRASGELVLRYDGVNSHSRPGVAVYDNSGVSDVEVVIGESDYHKLVDGDVYDDGIGSYQELSQKNDFRIVPSEARNGYQSLYEAVK